MNRTSLIVAASLLALVAPLARAQQPAATSPELSAYTALRNLALSGEACKVANVVIRRDAGVFTLKSGDLYFVGPIEGRVTAAVFLGDGEFTLTPPLECEKRSLAINTKTSSITEPFTEAVFHFSDETWAEL